MKRITLSILLGAAALIVIAAVLAAGVGIMLAITSKWGSGTADTVLFGIAALAIASTCAYFILEARDD